MPTPENKPRRRSRGETDGNPYRDALMRAGAELIKSTSELFERPRELATLVDARMSRRTLVL
jgi:hypothetical protein